MLDKLQRAFSFEETALRLRAQRQQVLSTNVANDNTPGYQARDIDFAATLSAKMGISGSVQGAATIQKTHNGHMDTGMMEGGGINTGLQYRVPHQSSVDGNTVELEAEKGRVTENAMHYLSVTNTLQQKFSWWSRFLQDTR